MNLNIYADRRPPYLNRWIKYCVDINVEKMLSNINVTIC
jgi:hypothetical protein